MVKDSYSNVKAEKRSKLEAVLTEERKVLRAQSSYNDKRSARKDDNHP
jgi:hypothetical protein